TTTPANDQYSTPARGYGLNAAWQWTQGPVALEVGADARLTDGTEREKFRFQNGVFTRLREAGGKTSVAGAYAEAAIDQGPWLVTGGVRLDRSRAYDARRLELDAQTGATTLNTSAPNRSDTTPTGRLGVRYQAAEGVHVRAAAYAGFRPPTLNELHRPFRVGNDITEANPTLKPETLQGLEAGLDGEGPFHWRTTVFYNRLKDPITNVTIGVGPGTFPNAGFVPAGGTLRQRRNAGEIEAWGVEGEAFGEVAQALSWRAAFAYTDAEVNGGSAVPQLDGLRPAQTPKWTVTGGLEWRVTQAVRLATDVRYESMRFEDDLNSRRLGAGVQVDARATWRFAPDLEVFLAAENLTDETLEVGETADGTESYSAPRTLRVGLTLRR
ncbi:MAG: TonB-dependent receptor, partial [Phenylobacterium sp.]|uniref:TonB-dependent receptor n=1 Tax=Phenylobacterium sp. TaxID=1871053 RepID=UPI001A629F18